MALLDDAAKKGLLQRARRAIARAIGVSPDSASVIARIPNPESLIPEDPQSLIPIPVDLRAGAFVTLRIKGGLRGCIGYPGPELPLIEVIERCAVSAAISDPRFFPLSLEEWNDIEIEVSVLGPIEAVADLKEVVVGRHGLVVEFGRRRGLLLPQVATEWNWNAEEFASQTCVKAGLPEDAWRKGAKLFKFEAEVFGEGGNEKRKT